jgi:hypothetical protein
MRLRKSTEFIHEGKYAAEVDVELHYSDDGWSPTLSALPARRAERSA